MDPYARAQEETKARMSANIRVCLVERALEIVTAESGDVEAGNGTIRLQYASTLPLSWLSHTVLNAASTCSIPGGSVQRVLDGWMSLGWCSFNLENRIYDRQPPPLPHSL